MIRRAAASVALAAAPGAALACALPPSIILTLPTGYYMLGAGLTVALTAALGAGSQHLPALRRHQLWDHPALPQELTSGLGFLALLGLLFFGFFGSRDPMHNLLTLVFWAGVWVALPLASLLLGNLWRPINPWTGPVRMVRLLLGRKGGTGLARLGHWPAVAGLFGFTWFQLIALHPDDPLTLARVIAGYWGLVFLLAVAEGEGWLALARALCLRPAVLLLDEPTEGLQPSMIALIRDTLAALKATGVATVLVEQRVEAVLSIADSVAFMVQGRVAEVVAAQGLTPKAPQFASYVGV